MSSEDEDEGAGVGKENSGDDNDDEDDEEGGDEELEEEGGKSKGDAFEKALERRMSLDFEVDDEAQELLSFDSLKKAAEELAAFPRITGPATLLLQQANHEFCEKKYEQAMHTYTRALQLAAGGKESFLELVLLLNAGECSLALTDPRQRELGETLLRRALDIVSVLECECECVSVSEGVGCLLLRMIFVAANHL